MHLFKKRRGWWNSTEQEIIEKEHTNVLSALVEIGEIFTKHRWMVDEKFFKTLSEELRRESDHSIKVQLELKTEGIKI